MLPICTLAPHMSRRRDLDAKRGSAAGDGELHRKLLVDPSAWTYISTLPTTSVHADRVDQPAPFLVRGQRQPLQLTQMTVIQ